MGQTALSRPDPSGTYPTLGFSESGLAWIVAGAAEEVLKRTYQMQQRYLNKAVV